MIEEIGTVTAIAGDQVMVARGDTSSCRACGSANHCGTSILHGLFRRRAHRTLNAWDPIGVRTGDRVVVGINEGTLHRASWIAFVPPLLALIGGGLLGEHFAHEPAGRELATIIGGLTGLFLGFIAARKTSELFLGDSRQHVRIVRVISKTPGLNQLRRG